MWWWYCSPRSSWCPPPPCWCPLLPMTRLSGWSGGPTRACSCSEPLLPPGDRGRPRWPWWAVGSGSCCRWMSGIVGDVGAFQLCCKWERERWSIRGICPSRLVVILISTHLCPEVVMPHETSLLIIWLAEETLRSWIDSSKMSFLVNGNIWLLPVTWFSNRAFLTLYKCLINNSIVVLINPFSDTASELLDGRHELMLTWHNYTLVAHKFLFWSENMSLNAHYYDTIV